MSQDELWRAVYWGQLDTVKSEVEQQIDLTIPFVKAGKSDYFLSFAIRRGNYDIVEYLVENGAVPTIPAAFPVAIEKGDVNIVRLLLSKQQLDVNKICDSTNKTPLSQAIDLNNYDMVDYLLASAKANPNSGETPSPLARAIDVNNCSMVKCLIENGAILNSAYLTSAIQKCHVDIVDLLLSKPEFDVDKVYESTNKTLLSQAIDLYSYNMVNYLLRSAEANPNSGETPSPLARAVQNGDTSIINLLFEFGAVINPSEDLLKEAIEKKSVGMIYVLVRNGAEVKDEELQVIQQLAKHSTLNFTEIINEASKLKLNNVDKDA